MSSSLVKLFAILSGLAYASIFAIPLLSNTLSTFESKDWKQTKGMVIAIKNKPRGADIRYKYVVDGKEFTGDRFAFASDNSNADKDLINERYHVGGDIELYFDPDNPSRSVVERRSMSIGCLFFPLAMIVMICLTAMSACNRSTKWPN